MAAARSTVQERPHLLDGRERSSAGLRDGPCPQLGAFDAPGTLMVPRHLAPRTGSVVQSWLPLASGLPS